MSTDKMTRRTLDLDENMIPAQVWKEYKDALSERSANVLKNILTFKNGNEVSNAD